MSFRPSAAIKTQVSFPMTNSQADNRLPAHYQPYTQAHYQPYTQAQFQPYTQANYQPYCESIAHTSTDYGPVYHRGIPQTSMDFTPYLKGALPINWHNASPTFDIPVKLAGYATTAGLGAAGMYGLERIISNNL
jgi:hypothetical protein